MADWAGSFGDEYTARNAKIPCRKTFWARVLPADCMSAHEIGCNRGANLEAIEGIPVSGCDINAHAVNIAREKGLDVTKCHGLASTRRADLIFTVGVLIHLDTPDLIRMMRHMRRNSFCYVLFNEYYSPYDVEIPYRDQRGALYKRDFGEIYSALYPNDERIGAGACGPEEGFDNTTWWLFKKS